MKRSELKNKIKRRLGWPMVKVELCDDQLNDHIDYSREKFIKWAIGNATDLIYFTLPLKAGHKFYDLPKGVLDIIEYDDDVDSMGGSQTLFSVENYFFNQGYYDPMFQYPYSLVGYHMVLDFMEALDRYNPDKYSWRYHRKTNQLELTPTPEYGNDGLTVERIDPTTNTVKSYTLDSPGYILLKANVIEGTTLPYVIREWDEVMKEIIPASELRIINSNEVNNNYFVLSSPAINSKLDIYKNGELYTNWHWHDDIRKIVRWTKNEEIHLNDELLCRYNKINTYNIEGSSMTETFDYTIDNFVITPLQLATKTFMLSRKTIKKEDIIINVNDKDYVYNSGFTVDTDNQTIMFGSFSLNNVLVNGSNVKITFVDEDSNIEEYNESLYDRTWILDYATALSKISLGLIRRKFASFNSIGNTSISLDGDMLVSEGQQEKEKLEEELRDEESYEGSYIVMG